MAFENFAEAFWHTVEQAGKDHPRGYLTFGEFCGLWDKHWEENRGMLEPRKFDYLNRISTMNNQPIFETKEFTAKQRRKVFGMGHELYYKKLLQWRFGLKRGWWVYHIGNILWIRELMLLFVHTRLGHWIFCKLSHQIKEDK